MKKPNILFLFPDTFRADFIPLDNKTKAELGICDISVQMPVLEELQKTATTFINTITPSPLCAPARACLASGCKYDSCRVPNNDYDYDTKLPTFYSALKDSGYHVAGVGKFDLHKPTHFWGLDGWVDELGEMGFTVGIDNAGKIDAVVSAIDTPKDPYMNVLDKEGLRQYHIDNMSNRGYETFFTELPQRLYCDNWIVDNALDILKNSPDEKPWFMQVNFTGPHSPLDITHSMWERTKDRTFENPHAMIDDDVNHNEIRQHYVAMCENIDAQIGRLIDYLKQTNQYDNTVIVFSSDHGDMLGDFGLFGKCQPQRASINIPLIINLPREKLCSINRTNVELQDLAQTFLEIAGAELPTADRSVSLIEHCKGKQEQIRQCSYSALNYNDRKWQCYLNNNYKVVYENDTLSAIYNLSDDPWEFKNLFPSLSQKEIDNILINISTERNG